MSASSPSATSNYLTAIGVLVFVVTLAVVAYDRRALKRRLAAAQGAAAGLTIELAVARDKVGELLGYLQEHDNWTLDGRAGPAPAPPAALDLAARWSGLVAPGSDGATAVGHVGAVAESPADT